MSLLETRFIYEDKFIVICQAMYESENGDKVTHIDVGYKDDDDDIVLYRTIMTI